MRYDPDSLVTLARELFNRAGIDDAMSVVMARKLVDADMFGHTTHGLAHVSPYLRTIAEGSVAKSGEPTVVTDSDAITVWDGNQLPGIWVTCRAIDNATAKAQQHGVGIVVVRRSFHIACLATYLLDVARQGRMIILCCSDPWVKATSVAPFGGTRGTHTPNPIAVGIPTRGDPIMYDSSVSLTTNAMVNRKRSNGEPMPGKWLLDGHGQPTDDPNVIEADPPGTVLPLGGIEHGYKGFGLALMVEALTQALSGFGRDNAPEVWGASIFVQIIDPQHFAGHDAFVQVSDWFAECCRANPPAPGHDRVRLPGERALALYREAERDGVELYPGIMDDLIEWATRLDAAVPDPIV